MRGLTIDEFPGAVAHKIDMSYDSASETWALSDEMRALADRLTATHELICLVEAGELHARGEIRAAHRLQYLVHLRGLELRSVAMRDAARLPCVGTSCRVQPAPSRGAAS